MDTNASSSGPGPVGNKRNSVKKLLDAYHDLIGGGDQPGQDGQGGPGMPGMPTAKPPMAMPGGSPAGAPPIAGQSPVTQKPMLPGLGGGMPPMQKPQMSMPPMQQPMAPQKPALPQAPMATPQAPLKPQMPQMPTAPNVSMPLSQAAGKPGMGSNAASDMQMLSGAGAGSMGGHMPNLRGMGQGIMGGVKAGLQKGGDLVKMITDHLSQSRQSHMDHERDILKQAIAAHQQGGGAPDSMRGHEQEFFDQTRNTGNHLNVNKPKLNKKTSKPKDRSNEPTATANV